jgi:16S rRNA (uracil1498-N3)-methyltransferase
VRIPRIYTGQVLQAETEFDLEPGPSQHVARALRMQAGDDLVLFDGRGGEYPASIITVDRKRAVVRCQQLRPREAESALSIHLGIAVSRGERMDWVVQKATELGVATISPLLTARTEVKLNEERTRKKLQHWQGVVVSACEQCGRNRLPAIHPVTDLQSWLGAATAENKYVLHHRAGDHIDSRARPRSVALLIGPEGGLDDIEIEAAEKAGFQAMQLGPRVLRTETAPLAALAIIQSRWGDMGSNGD